MTHPAWADAITALRLLRIDPGGLGGVWLRARVGPPRDGFLSALGPEVRRIAPDTTDEALFGGLDVTLTLANGRPSYTDGLLAAPGMLALTGADRCTRHLAAQLAQVLDRGAGHSLIALDEGTEDEAPPASLTDRLAFHISLEGLAAADCPTLPDPGPGPLASIDVQAIRDLTVLAATLGVPSLRAPLFAIRAARAHGALFGRAQVAPEDVEAAARLVLGPRARVLPEPPADAPPEPEPDQDQPDAPPPDDNDSGATRPPEDVLLEATLAALPPDILARLANGKAMPRGAGSSAQGALRKGGARGRPLPSRRGRADGRARVDLIATLRSAAPWQPMRRAQTGRAGLQIRPTDIHLRRNQSRTDRLLIFAVDASGSAAMNRLAEAKGAVELLLAEAYASRDHVALISYAKEGADLLLPPTRSLVRTKRQLAQLPGGGGTPLAMGLREALLLAETARRKGFQPALVVIADGRANIALSGAANRAEALADALTVARQNRLQPVPAVVIDMSKRPEPQLQEVAEALAARYAPMPYADARRLSGVVGAEIG